MAKPVKKAKGPAKLQKKVESPIRPLRQIAFKKR